MVGSRARCDWGHAWPSRSRTQGAAFAGGKGKPEDAEMRSARRVIQVCLVVEPTISPSLPAEQLPRVGLDRPLQLLVGDAALGRDRRPGLDHEGGLVALAAARLRRQVGRVGLDQDPVLGHLRRREQQILGAGIGGVAGKRAVPAPLGRVADPLRRREAVQDHRLVAGAGVERLEDLVGRGRLPLGVAGVDHDRQVELDRDLDLRGEGPSLLVRARVLAVEVEPGLADRPHPLVRTQLEDFRGGRLVEAARLVRVAPDRGEDRLVAPGARHRLGVRLAVHPHRQHPVHPRGDSRRDQFVLAAVAEEEMGVGVDHRPAQPILRRMADPADYYREIYLRGLGGETPEIPVPVAELEERAVAALDPKAANYVCAGAGSEETMRANREAFSRRRIVPRMLRDVAERDLSTTVLGTAMPAPLLLAPIGVQTVVHEDGELATARAAAALGVPMIASTASHHSLEEIAAAGGGAAPRWFQLYWPNDPGLARSFGERAEAAGYEAIVLTVDTFIPGWKPRDLQQAWLPFLNGLGVANYFQDPVFRAALEKTPEEDPGMATGHFLGVQATPALSWDDLEALREMTSLPIVVKGIQHAEDAREAVRRGIDGVVVSNHGGRQVDGAIASLDALPAIAEAAG